MKRSGDLTRHPPPDVDCTKKIYRNQILCTILWTTLTKLTAKPSQSALLDVIFECVFLLHPCSVPHQTTSLAEACEYIRLFWSFTQDGQVIFQKWHCQLCLCSRSVAMWRKCILDLAGLYSNPSCFSVLCLRLRHCARPSWHVPPLRPLVCVWLWQQMTLRATCTHWVMPTLRICTLGKSNAHNMNADTREKELTDVSLWPLGVISIAFRVLLCKRV